MITTYFLIYIIIGLVYYTSAAYRSEYMWPNKWYQELIIFAIIIVLWPLFITLDGIEWFKYLSNNK